MAESFSVPPPDEIQAPDKPHLEALPIRRKPGVKGILDTIRFNMMNGSRERQENLDEDEDDEKKKKRGRFLSRIFGAIVGKEEVPHEQRDRGSIFFGIGEVGKPEGDQDPTVVEKTSNDYELPLDLPIRFAEPIETEPSSAENIEYEPLDLAPTEVMSEIQATSEAAEAMPDDAELEVTLAGVESADPVEPEISAELVPDAPENVYIQRGINPETAIVLGAYEHHRITKLKKRETTLEKQVGRLEKQINRTEKSKEVTEQVRPSVAEAKPQVVFERSKPASSEQKRPEKALSAEPRPEKNPELKRTYVTETSREQQRSAVEKAVEKHSKELSKEKKQEAIERILVAPEFKGALDTEFQKEITYERSHEAKDMDAQSQSAWVALQAAADATAKANAQALADAGSQIPIAVTGDALKKADAQKAKEDREGLYKKAALSGFVTAIVIVAVLLVILLLQRK